MGILLALQRSPEMHYALQLLNFDSDVEQFENETFFPIPNNCKTQILYKESISIHIMKKIFPICRSANLINYNHNQFKLMLRSNNSTIQPRSESGQIDGSSCFKPLQTNTQFQRGSFKENQGEYISSVKAMKNFTQSSQSDSNLMSSRLQSIRKKYDYTRATRYDKPDQGQNTPLKDSKKCNRIINGEFQKSKQKQTTLQLQRSFSFVNKEQKYVKPEETSQNRSQENGSILQVREERAQLRKNSSFGLFEDSQRYKFSGTPGYRYTPSDQNRLNYLQNTEIKLNQNRFSEYKQRTVSEYNKKTQNSSLIANQPLRDYKEKLCNIEQPRLESIDKINIKIKQILQSIGQNQKVFEAEMKQNHNYTVNHGQIHHQIPTEITKSYLHSTNTFKSSLFNDQKTTNQKLLTQTDEKQRKIGYHQQSQAEKYCYPARIKTQQSYSIAKSNISRQNEYQQGRLSSGKNLDLQIKKIQDKIKKSEQQKARLNIKFQQMKSSTHLLKQDVKSTSISNKNSSADNQKYLIEQKRNFDKIDVPKPALNKAILQNEQPQIKITVTKPHISQLIPKAESFKFKMMKVECQIEEEPISARQSKRFIDNLRQQVRLDEQLRNAKIWFDNFAQAKDKWVKMQQLLKEKGINKNDEQIKQQFQSTLQEHNPFYTTRDTKESIESLIQKYMTANGYWQSNILGCFDTQQLKCENFTEDKLDLEKKGYLSVEDFVRFLNIETGTFYRNRDLILIFRRLSTDRLSFGAMMKAIAKQ